MENRKRKDTGETDYRGNKIYEGSIVYCPIEQVYDTVIWDEESNLYRTKNNYDPADEIGGSLIVVGSIYDNPELLELGN